LESKELREALTPFSFCEEEELAQSDEFNISPYKGHMSSSRRPS